MGNFQIFKELSNFAIIIVFIIMIVKMILEYFKEKRINNQYTELSKKITNLQIEQDHKLTQIYDKLYNIVTNRFQQLINEINESRKIDILSLAGSKILINIYFENIKSKILNIAEAIIICNNLEDNKEFRDLIQDKIEKEIEYIVNNNNSVLKLFIYQDQELDFFIKTIEWKSISVEEIIKIIYSNKLNKDIKVDMLLRNFNSILMDFQKIVYTKLENFSNVRK